MYDEIPDVVRSATQSSKTRQTLNNATVTVEEQRCTEESDVPLDKSTDQIFLPSFSTWQRYLLVLFANCFLQPRVFIRGLIC